MSNLYILDHPLIQSKVTLLRDNKTGNKEFRELISEIASLICYEATKDIPTKTVEFDTPMGKSQGTALLPEIGVVPILRTGLSMVDGVLNLIPTAKVGHIGLYRDPNTLTPVEYYCKLPESSEDCEILLLDPMLATGNSSVSAIQFMKERGIKKIKFLCVIAAPEGIKKLQTEHPDVDIYTAALDDCIDENGYIVPGLGDAGIRLYGTK